MDKNICRSASQWCVILPILFVDELKRALFAFIHVDLRLLLPSPSSRGLCQLNNVVGAVEWLVWSPPAGLGSTGQRDGNLSDAGAWHIWAVSSDSAELPGPRCLTPAVCRTAELSPLSPSPFQSFSPLPLRLPRSFAPRCLSSIGRCVWMKERILLRFDNERIAASFVLWCLEKCVHVYVLESFPEGFCVDTWFGVKLRESGRLGIYLETKHVCKRERKDT